jgi:hypothetical protein
MQSFLGIYGEGLLDTMRVQADILAAYVTMRPRISHRRFLYPEQTSFSPMIVAYQ